MNREGEAGVGTVEERLESSLTTGRRAIGGEDWTSASDIVVHDGEGANPATNTCGKCTVCTEAHIYHFHIPHSIS